MEPQSDSMGTAVHPVSTCTKNLESIPLCVCVKIGEFLDNGGVENYCLYDMRTLEDFLVLLRLITRNSKKINELPKKIDKEEVIELMRCYKRNNVNHFMRELMFKTYNAKQNFKMEFVLKFRRNNPKKELLKIEYTINKNRNELYENKKQNGKRRIKSYKNVNGRLRVKNHTFTKKSK